MARRSRGEALPKWSDKHGWRGGGADVLYTYTDKLTGHKVVLPGGRTQNDIGRCTLGGRWPNNF